MATGVPSAPETLSASCPPFITLTTIASDNSTISVTWSELVYNTNAGNGDLEASDFTLSISGGVATVAATPSSIVINGRVYTLGLNLTGGEQTIRVFLTITGCPSGVEQIRFQAEANSMVRSSFWFYW